ncbi:MAG: 4Fe-4S binding protein [Desulfovibrio sp.]
MTTDFKKLFSPVHSKRSVSIALRLAVQAAFALFHVFLAWKLWLHIAWALGRTETYAPKPAAVDGFLPIVSLMSLKRWLLTGQWDSVHPAALTILFALVAMCMFFRRGFCGWICPIGFLSNLLDRLGRRLGLARPVSGRIRYLLWIPKYLLLAGALGAFVLFLSLPAINQFRGTPYYFAADARMYLFFAHPSFTLLAILTALVAASLLVRNFWCRFLCPYGALLGLVALCSPVAVQRDADTCIACGKCTRNCPNGIAVDRATRLNTPECIGCGECVANCPVPQCLTLRAGGLRAPYWLAGAGAIAVLLGFYLWGRTTGHWDAELPREMLRGITRRALGL